MSDRERKRIYVCEMERDEDIKGCIERECVIWRERETKRWVRDID